MMEQFSLDTWLKDKSRKVVTRDGKPVRIVCWDRPGFYPIIGYTEDELNLCISSTKSGSYCKDGARSQNDLFFADEEKKLTEFESKLADLLVYNHPMDIESANSIARRKSKILLEFARKEIREEQQEKLGTIEMPIDVIEPYYIKGKQDALKDLPKWKKATENKDFDNHILLFEDEDRVVLTEGIYKGEYYIELEDLKTLPKE